MVVIADFALRQIRREGNSIPSLLLAILFVRQYWSTATRCCRFVIAGSYRAFNLVVNPRTECLDCGQQSFYKHFSSLGCTGS